MAPQGPQAPVVVGTDGSSSATAALCDAAGVAREARVPLHIVSAYRTSTPLATRRAARHLPVGLDIDYAGHGYAIAHAALEDAEEIAQRLGARTQRHAVKATPSLALCAVAREVEADLIVVGNRGIASPLRRLRPPVCDRVSHHAACEVLVVDTRAHWPSAPSATAARRDSRWT
jgi:nucleotide-binding universal stress UspA family protein